MISPKEFTFVVCISISVRIVCFNNYFEHVCYENSVYIKIVKKYIRRSSVDLLICVHVVKAVIVGYTSG